MDPVTLFAACSISVRSSLFVARGGAVVCDRRAEITTSDDSDATDRQARYIAEAARRFDIPETWIREVMRAESGGRTWVDVRPITSPAGALGLMQVMPRTYDELRARHGLGADRHDPHNSILAGAAYLREMYDRYGWPTVLAAYNAGPARVDEHLAGGRRLPAETRRYVAEVESGIAGSAPAKDSATPPRAEKASPLFADRAPDGHLGVAFRVAPTGGLPNEVDAPFARVRDDQRPLIADGSSSDSSARIAPARRSRNAAPNASSTSLFVPSLGRDNPLEAPRSESSVSSAHISQQRPEDLFRRQGRGVSVKSVKIDASATWRGMASD